VEIVVRHDLVQNSPQALHTEQVTGLFRAIQAFRSGAERRFQPVALAGECLGGIEILDAAKLVVTPLLEVEADRVSRFGATRLTGDHAKVDAAHPGRKDLRIARYRYHAI